MVVVRAVLFTLEMNMNYIEAESPSSGPTRLKIIDFVFALREPWIRIHLLIDQIIRDQPSIIKIFK